MGEFVKLHRCENVNCGAPSVNRIRIEHEGREFYICGHCYYELPLVRGKLSTPVTPPPQKARRAPVVSLNSRRPWHPFARLLRRGGIVR